jgi:hypothetical protein
MPRSPHTAFVLLLLGTAPILAAQAPAQKPTEAAPKSPEPAKPAPIVGKLQPVRGVVYDDANKNRTHDASEKGLPNVRVSNGRDITTTDANGRYELTIDDDDVVFVIKPRNWMTPVNAQQIPQFSYVHKPNGSPKGLKYPGVEPTGPLPASVDFPLYAHPEPDTFKALIFGDTQPRDVEEAEFVAHDVVEPLARQNQDLGATMGVTLGDVVFNDLSVFQPLTQAVSLLGLPWYNVPGNHDTNQDVDDDTHSTETWQRVFGPAYYSFNHGPTHFIVLDDIRWLVKANGKRGYIGGLGPDQMQFVRNDLATVPDDQLVVLMMHIPLVNVEDRKELYDLIARRRFALSISAHTHYQEHIFIDSADGFTGPVPHHHVVNVTACGSWWGGARDERGIPHTTMRDGAPNGYSIFTFDGSNYAIEFRAASRHPEYQMNIYAPETLEAAKAAETEILVNVFAGSPKTKVEMRLGDSGDWIPMERKAVEDPAYVETKAREDTALNAVLEQKNRENKPLTASQDPLPKPIKSPHIWAANLPANPPKGSHAIHVRETDMFGKTHTDRRWIRID